MDTAQQRDVESALSRSLADGRLDKPEEKTLRRLIEPLADDREALAFVRNLAFRLARGAIEAHPLDTLRWLERIDKMVDHAARPPQQGGRADEPACAFSPGEDCLGMIQRQLAGADRSIDICVFTVTDDRITDRIIAAHRRGIGVRLITDNDKQFDSGSDIARMVKAGVPTRFDPDNDHMHHKFAVIDDARLVNGSYNWTRGATRNHENLLVFSHAETVRRYAAEFERLWRAFR